MVSAVETRPPESYSDPERALGLAVIAQAVRDRDLGWLTRDSESREFWCDVAGLDQGALAARATLLHWEWLWDLAAAHIQAAAWERAP